MCVWSLLLLISKWARRAYEALSLCLQITPFILYYAKIITFFLLNWPMSSASKWQERTLCTSTHAVSTQSQTTILFLPWAVVGTSKQPAVPGLLDQHINYLSPIEGQQGGVGANRLVGHPGLHDSSSTTTTTSCWVCSEAKNASLWRRGWRNDKWNTKVRREQFVKLINFLGKEESLVKLLIKEY